MVLFSHCPVDFLAPAKRSAYTREGFLCGDTDRSLFALSRSSLSLEEPSITRPLVHCLVMRCQEEQERDCQT